MLVAPGKLPQQGGTGEWNKIGACNDDAPVSLEFRRGDREKDLEACSQDAGREVDQNGLERVEAETSDYKTRETRYGTFCGLASGAMI